MIVARAPVRIAEQEQWPLGPRGYGEVNPSPL